jgi:hypothetical protein
VNRKVFSGGVHVFSIAFLTNLHTLLASVVVNFIYQNIVTKSIKLRASQKIMDAELFLWP